MSAEGCANVKGSHEFVVVTMSHDTVVAKCKHCGCVKRIAQATGEEKCACKKG